MATVVSQDVMGPGADLLCGFGHKGRSTD